MKNKKLIHFSAIQHVYKRKNAEGQPVPFSLKFVKLSTGEIIKANNVVCTSDNSFLKTLNIKFLDSKEIRKIRQTSIIEINETEVYL